ncbi:hypothetical protein, partial [Burkholderia cenocepacia]|uniref:hypothetical protein n=1 Tax=Burkholderia cenocepacia TaxID=95486 RepID=UPI002AC327C2
LTRAINHSIPFPQSLLSSAIQLLIDRIFNQDRNFFSAAYRQARSYDQLSVRGSPPPFHSAAAQIIKSLRNERFIRRVHVKFANPPSLHSKR